MAVRALIAEEMRSIGGRNPFLYTRQKEQQYADPVLSVDVPA
jgi:hypothetical protein